MSQRIIPMPGGGIIWGAIISVPFWLIVILLVKAGFIAMETIIFAGLVFPGLLLFLILTPSSKAKRDKQNWDIFIKNIPTPTFESKTHPQEPLETGTPD